MIRTYSELMKFASFRDRYEYLRLGGKVGEYTFGFDRYLNQAFYKSKEWNQLRDQIIIRDRCCDLGVPGYEIGGRVLIHHMNPITKQDILDRTNYLLNPDFLITTTKQTHDAIHYGNYESLLGMTPVERFQNDTCPWRR